MSDPKPPLFPFSEAELRALPKVDLHCHLDGSLRPETLKELYGALGGGDAEELPLPGRQHGSLHAYLAVFRHTVAVLQTEAALERVAFELAEDAARENVRWLEVRYCPPLSQEKGLSPNAIVDAVQAGLARASQRFGIASGQILCALRDRSPEESLEVARLALRHTAAPGVPGAVVGFDLAGPERAHPARAHAQAFALTRERHLWRTCHAGEDAGPASVAEAVEILGANRIGHAVTLTRDAALLREVVARGIALEVCLSSNVQTGAVPSLAAHPLPQLLAAGARVALCTDNRLVSDTTVTRELGLAQDGLGVSRAALLGMLETGIDRAFLARPQRAILRAELAAHLADAPQAQGAPAPGERERD